MREEFEKWIVESKAKILTPANLWKKENGNYGFNVIQLAWEAYQAGYKQACHEETTMEMKD